MKVKKQDILAAITAIFMLMPNALPLEKVVINHLNWDPSEFPQEILDGVRTKKIIFIHVSVGSNIVEGLNSLRKTNPTRYDLTINHAPVNPDRLDSPAFGHEHFTSLPSYIAGTTDKTTPKTMTFDSLMRSPDGNGVHWGDAVDIAYYKYCWVDIRRYEYIDPTQIFTKYITKINELSNDYSNCVFVHFTCPIKGNMDDDFEKLDNIKRHQYNDLLRAHVDTAGGYLFDIADIEAHDKNDVLQTFSWDGNLYPKMWYVPQDPDNDGWSSDGGHLNRAGKERIALAMWRLWATIQSNLVPVELAFFRGCKINDGVELQWKTCSEYMNYGFEIQRSTDRMSFMPIAFLKGHGTTTTENIYRYIDKNISNGTYHYRLMQIDVNGNFEYSDTIQLSINLPFTLQLAEVYPNPFNASVHIEYRLPLACQTKISVYNVLGEKTFRLLDDFKEAGTHTINWHLGKNGISEVSSGIYYIKLEARGMSAYAKIIHLK